MTEEYHEQGGARGAECFLGNPALASAGEDDLHCSKKLCHLLCMRAVLAITSTKRGRVESRP